MGNMNQTPPTVVFSVGPQPGERHRTDRHGIKTVLRINRPVHGRLIIRHEGDAFFGTGKAWQSRVMSSPTWIQLHKQAQNMLEATGDWHHMFLEGIQVIGTEQVKGETVQVCRFLMGS